MRQRFPPSDWDERYRSVRNGARRSETRPRDDQGKEELGGLSDQTASEASNVSAAAEEQPSAIRQIGQSDEALETQAEELQNRSNEFETG